MRWSSRLLNIYYVSYLVFTTAFQDMTIYGCRSIAQGWELGHLSRQPLTRLAGKQIYRSLPAYDRITEWTAKRKLHRR